MFVMVSYDVPAKRTEIYKKRNYSPMLSTARPARAI